MLIYTIFVFEFKKTFLLLIEINILIQYILSILYTLISKLFLENYIINTRIYIVVNRSLNKLFNQNLVFNFAIVFILFLDLTISRFRFILKNLRSAILQQMSIILHNCFCNLKTLIVFLFLFFFVAYR